MTAMRALLVAVVCSCPLAISAVEPLVLNDLRAGAGTMFDDFSSRTNTTTTSPAGTVLATTSDEHHDDAIEFRAGIQYLAGTLGPGGGLIYGAQMADYRARFHDDTSTTTIDGPVVDALAGYAVSPVSGFHLEATPIAGIGYAFLDIRDRNGQVIGNRSLYIEYGFRVAAYATIDDCWQIGLEVPFMVGRWRPKYGYLDGAGNHIEVSDKRVKSGGGVMLSLGVRF